MDEQGFLQIDQLKGQLDARRPLPEHTVKSLHEQLVLEWTYHSNAIEGNTLTLKETKVVLEGITVGGKTLREHFEAINHREAIVYVEQIIAAEEEFSEWQIKNIHQLILKNIDPDNAGRYRTENVLISGAVHRPPDFVQVPFQMQELIHWYKEHEDLHPVEKAARLHSDFVKIHPFINGNGRTARLLMNFELMKAGYLPVVIKAENRLQYYEVLDLAHTEGKITELLQFIGNLEIEALNFILSFL